MSEWEQLHRKAKQLEGRLEVRAACFSALLSQWFKRGRKQRRLVCSAVLFRMANAGLLLLCCEAAALCVGTVCLWVCVWLGGLRTLAAVRLLYFCTRAATRD